VVNEFSRERSALIINISQIYFWNFKVRHLRCVSNKSNYKVYAYIVQHNYVLGGSYFLFVKHNYMFRPQMLVIFRLYNENLSIGYTVIQ
jgi:hypothetical protein